MHLKVPLFNKGRHHGLKIYDRAGSKNVQQQLNSLHSKMDSALIDKTMFAGINMFWARLRLILDRAVRRELKWALRRAQNIFMPKNISCIAIVITSEGIEKINTENSDNQTVWKVFLSPTL